MEDLVMNRSRIRIADGNGAVLNGSLLLNQSFNVDQLEGLGRFNLTTIIVNIIILPILIMIGIFGNISTLIVFLRKKKKTPSLYFIVGLAFSDLLLLLLRLIANIYNVCHVFYTDAIRHVIPNSYAWIFVSNLCQRGGNLFISAIVVERFAAVWFPLKLRQFWTSRKALLVAYLVFLLASLDLVSGINAIIFSMTDNMQGTGDVSTQSEAARYRHSLYKNKFVYLWSFICRMLFDMVPLPFVFLFNIFIIIGIKRSMHIDLNSIEKTRIRKEKENRTTKMLLTISVLFIILSSPYNIFIVLTGEKIIRGSEWPLVIYEVIKMLHILNSVINFVVYGIGDKSVRQQYLTLWKLQKVPSINGASSAMDSNLTSGINVCVHPM